MKIYEFENESIKTFYSLYNDIKTKVMPKKRNVMNILLIINDFSNIIYEIIHEEYEPNHLNEPANEIEIRKLCKFIADDLYPYFVREIYKPYFEKLDQQDFKDMCIAVEDKLYSLMALRNLKYFAFYLEREKNINDRIWDKTMNIFESYFHYASKIILLEQIELIRASYFPGAGKTYAGNLTCAFWFGYNPSINILRITASDDLAKTFTTQIKGMILSDNFKKVFPFFDRPEKEIFETSTSKMFKFKFSNVFNFFSTTRNGQAIGKRAKVLMIDDITKGVEEAYKVDVHIDAINKYDANWTSRTDNDKMFKFLLGTMWNSYDLLNEVMQREKKKNDLYEDVKFKYTTVNNRYSKDVTTVLISVPLLDYVTDESTCPLRYTTEKARQKREDFNDKAMFEINYQQNPQEPEQIIFGYNKLKTYKEIIFEKDKNKTFETAAFLDPNRQGLNYVCMFICRRYRKEDNTWSLWYAIGVIYELKIVTELLEKIKSYIYKFNVDKIGIENNTDTSLPYTIKKEMAKEYNYKFTVNSVYSYEHKEEKIYCANPFIKGQIVFPDPAILTDKEFKLFMQHFTSYDATGKNKYDDAPDCVAMFSNMVCAKEIENSVKIVKNNSLRL